MDLIKYKCSVCGAVYFPPRLDLKWCSVCSNYSCFAVEEKMDIPTIISDDGFRGWKILNICHDGRLISPRICSLQFMAGAADESFWNFGKPFEAKRETFQNTIDTCTPGIHSYKQEFAEMLLWEQMQISSSGVEVNLDQFLIARAIVRIKLWGLVQEHEFGYRSEFAYPDLIFVSDPGALIYVNLDNMQTYVSLREYWKYQEILPISSIKQFIEFKKGALLNCRACEKDFVLTPQHRKWFEDRNYQLPKSCKNCVKTFEQQVKSTERFAKKFKEAKGGGT